MKKTLAFALLLIAVPAFAHPGHDSNPLQDGLLHPLTGLDHLLMLLGTGVLAALTGRTLALPLATLAFLQAQLGGFAVGQQKAAPVGERIGILRAARAVQPLQQRPVEVAEGVVQLLALPGAKAVGPRHPARPPPGYGPGRRRPARESPVPCTLR